MMKLKRKNTPLLTVELFSKHGTVVGDGRARSVPLKTDRQFDIPLASVHWSGEMNEVAATKRTSILQRLRSWARVGLYGL